MARSAFLPAIALLALAPAAGAQVVIGGPAEISVDLSALDALRPARPLARTVLTAPTASLPVLPAPLAPAAPTMRPASVLQPSLPAAPERAALVAPTAIGRASPPSLATARVTAPGPQLRTVLAPARLAAPQAVALAAMPGVKGEAAPRLTASPVTPPSEIRLRTASLEVADAPALVALPAVPPRRAPDLDPAKVVRAALPTPSVSSPSAPVTVPNETVPDLHARPVLLSPRLEAPAHRVPDAPPQLERHSQGLSPAALFATDGIVAPTARAIDAPRGVLPREAPGLVAPPYLLRVTLRAPQGQLPGPQPAIPNDAPPRVAARLVAPRLAAPTADAIEQAAAIAAATIQFAAPVHSAANVVAPEPRALISHAVLTIAEAPALRASERALPVVLHAPASVPIDATPAVESATPPGLGHVAHVVPPSFEVAVLRPAAPAPLPPTLAPVLNTDPVQNAVLREPPPPSSASRNLPDSRSRAVPLVNERLAFVSEEPPPPAALGPTPRIPGPRGTTPAAPATKVPPKPNESEGTAPPAHAATPADPNPVTPQAVPAPVIASPKGGAQSSASAAEPEKGERGALRLQFAPDTTALPADVERALSPVMAALQRAPKSRIVLRGYAAGSGDAASRGKRVALGRVLELRSYFIAHGIDSTRIDVRALGAPEDKGIADRVDIGLLD